MGSGHLPPSLDEDLRALEVWSIQCVKMGVTDRGSGIFLAVPRVCEAQEIFKASISQQRVCRKHRFLKLLMSIN